MEENKPRIYDLHIHSSYSDGDINYEQILEKVKKFGLGGFSVTDHNCIASASKEIVAKAEGYGITAIEGVEISSQMPGDGRKISLHILGYAENFDKEKLNEGLRGTVAGYTERAKKIIEKCRELGMPISYQEARISCKSLYLNRNNIAKEIIRSRPDITFDRAVKMAFVEDSEDWFLTPFQAIELIKESGGVPILAHPGKIIESLLVGNDKERPIIEELIESGLSGIEVFYPSHTKEEIASLVSVAQKYGLLITGGTDYHGSFGKVEIGEHGIKEKEFVSLTDILGKLS